MKKYPQTSREVKRIQDWQARNGIACDRCKQPFAKGELCVTIEIRVSFMRGDDEYEFYHPACEDEATTELTCNTCGTTCASEKNLCRHMRKAHTTPAPAREGGESV